MNATGQLKAKNRRRERAIAWEVKHLFGNNAPETKTKQAKAVAKTRVVEKYEPKTNKEPSRGITAGFLARIDMAVNSMDGKTRIAAQARADARVKKARAARRARPCNKEEKSMFKSAALASTAPVAA